MPYNHALSDDEIKLIRDPGKNDPHRGMVIKPEPWDDDPPPWLDEYEAARLAFAHGITGRREEPTTTPDHHP